MQQRPRTSTRRSRRASLAALVATVTAFGTAGLAMAPAAGAATPSAAGAAAPAAGTAPGAPGAMSHFDLARKDCLGTARNTHSKVWFTVAGGVLSDVYYPTDGQHQRRDPAVRRHRRLDVHRPPDPRHDLHRQVPRPRPAWRAASPARPRTAATARHRLHHRPTAQQRRDADERSSPRAAGTAAVYVRYDGTVNGNGGGGDPEQRRRATTRSSTPPPGTPCPSSFDTKTATNAANRDYAQPVYAALRADRPFPTASSGYAGTASDGLVQLDAAHALARRCDGSARRNVVQTRRWTSGARQPFHARPGLRLDAAGAVAHRRRERRRPLRPALPRRTGRAGASTTRSLRPRRDRRRACRERQRGQLCGTYYLLAPTC